MTIAHLPIEVCPKCHHKRVGLVDTEHAQRWWTHPLLGKVLINCVGEIIGKAAPPVAVTTAAVAPTVEAAQVMAAVGAPAAETGSMLESASGDVQPRHLPHGSDSEANWPGTFGPRGRQGPLEQGAQLERVTSELAQRVLAFCEVRRKINEPRFRADELREHINLSGVAVAPGSPDRVLRELRKRGLVDYEVIDRRRSIYELKNPAQLSLTSHENSS